MVRVERKWRRCSILILFERLPSSSHLLQQSAPPCSRTTTMLALAQPRPLVVMASSCTATTAIACLVVAVSSWLLLEVVFYLLFHLCLVPTANRRVAPAPYMVRCHQVGTRHEYVVRILERVAQTAATTERRRALTEFLLAFFERQEEAEATSYNNKFKRQAASFTASCTTTTSTSSKCKSATINRADSLTRQSSRGSESTLSSVAPASDEEHVTFKVDGLNDNSKTDSHHKWTIPELDRAHMESLFAWAEFGKDVTELTVDEANDLAQTFCVLETRLGLSFDTTTTMAWTADGTDIDASRNTTATCTVDDGPEQGSRPSRYRVKRQTLDDLTATHRPLCVYACVALVRFLAALHWRWLGFSWHQTPSGLRAWVRRAGAQQSTTATTVLHPAEQRQTSSPFIFFHGLAPAAIATYSSMIRALINHDNDRAVVIVENPSISWNLLWGWNNLTESDVVQGVKELLPLLDVTPPMYDETMKRGRITVGGHSFGTAPLTWLLYDPVLRDCIQEAILLDPVTILLSSPDVMNNFLYRKDSALVSFISKELLTQKCLRRHFAGYNSDLWLDDFVPSPHSTTKKLRMLVCLSEKDDVIHAPNVREEVERHSHVADLLYWPDTHHGACLFQPQKWKQIRHWMTQSSSSSSSSSKESMAKGGETEYHGAVPYLSRPKID